MKSDIMSSAVMLVVMLMAIDQTSTLTTFGTNKNTENDQNKTNPPPVVRGRECKTDSDCSGIQNTICMTDARDRKLRCLCVDKAAPKNGACPRLPKPLSYVCGNDHDCIEGAECSAPANSTSNSNVKKCMCKEGYMEEDHMCSSGFLTAVPSITSLILAYSFLRLVSKNA